MNPWILILLLAGVLQSVLFSRISFFGASPNPLLVIVICWTVLRGGREGIIWGWAGGLILDLLSSAPFGTFTISMMTIAFLIGLSDLFFLGPTILFPLAATLIASPLFEILGWAIMQTLGWEIGSVRLWTLLIPTTLLNTLFVFPLFPLMKRINRWSGERSIEWT